MEYRRFAMMSLSSIFIGEEEHKYKCSNTAKKKFVATYTDPNSFKFRIILRADNIGYATTRASNLLEWFTRKLTDKIHYYNHEETRLTPEEKETMLYKAKCDRETIKRMLKQEIVIYEVEELETM